MDALDRLEAWEARVDREFLRAVRDCAKVIVAHDMEAEALRLWKVVRKHDLYISAPPPANKDVKVIDLQHAGMCQSKRCGQAMPRGMQAVWIHGVGCWHLDCYDSDRPAGYPERF